MAAIVALFSGVTTAAPASPEVRKETMQVFQRIFCGDTGRGVAFLYAQGRAYGHIEGIRDQKLFDVDVYAVQQSVRSSTPYARPRC